MELKGKCKEAFEKWYLFAYYPLARVNSNTIIELSRFYNMTTNFKFGCYVDFFDSVGMIIDVCKDTAFPDFFYSIMFKGNTFSPETNYTRPEARTKAIEKAVELYNEKIGL